MKKLALIFLATSLLAADEEVILHMKPLTSEQNAAIRHAIGTNNITVEDYYVTNICMPLFLIVETNLQELVAEMKGESKKPLIEKVSADLHFLKEEDLQALFEILQEEKQKKNEGTRD